MCTAGVAGVINYQSVLAGVTHILRLTRWNNLALSSICFSQTQTKFRSHSNPCNAMHPPKKKALLFSTLFLVRGQQGVEIVCTARCALLLVFLNYVFTNFTIRFSSFVLSIRRLHANIAYLHRMSYMIHSSRKKAFS